MNIEFEIKVLNISVEKSREKLKQLGAEFVGNKNFRRYVYDMNPSQEGRWIRLRTDGNITTLTHKHIIYPNLIDGTKEWEIVVDSFKTTRDLLRELGYQEKSYQENNRESYVLDGCCIEIDTWPMIPSYLEIEGSDKESVLAMLTKLHLNDMEKTSENTIQIYHRYGIIDFEDYKYISFKEMKKELI